MTEPTRVPPAVTVDDSTPAAGGLLRWEQDRFERVSGGLDLNPATVSALHYATRSLVVELPLESDDGSTIVFTGYRVQHSNALGPGKGGTRFRAGLDLDDITALARLMTWKTALHGLPFGGAKGGVDCDPAGLSQRELHEVTRLYTLAILPLIGSDVDVAAPDIGTDEQTMAWMLHTAAEAGRSDPAIVTGKPALLGGSRFRPRSTGVGVAHITQLAWEKLGRSIGRARITIEGFGSVGYWAAAELHDRGALIVGVGDITGSITKESGLDPTALHDWVVSGHDLVDYPDADHLDGSILTIPCDIAIPAALEGTITEMVAAAMTAELVVEGANGPTAPIAEAHLHSRGIAVVPDLVANGGGVISSYFEWAQNHQRIPWTETEERRRVLDRLEHTWNRLATCEPDTWRDEALGVAIIRVTAAMELTGQVAARHVHRPLE